MLRYRAVLLSLMVALLPSTVTAQSVQIALDAFGGAMIPAGDLYDEMAPDFALRFGHKGGFSFGGRVAVWPTSRIAIEAEAAYAASDLDIRLLALGEEPFDSTFSANVFLGSINVLWAFIRPPLEPLAVYVSGGLGIVSRSGDGIDFLDGVLEAFGRDFDETTDVAAVIGAGLRYAVASGFALRADVRDYISSFKDEDLVGDSKLQNDILITVSLEAFFGGG